MPTYTYRCTKCGDLSEVFQPMSDEPLKRCKKCRGKIQRTFHPVGIVLKGPGFHRNDYRTTKRPSEKSSGERSSDEKSSGEKSSGESSGEKSSGETGASEKKADGKPAEKKAEPAKEWRSCAA